MERLLVLVIIIHLVVSLIVGLVPNVIVEKIWLLSLLVPQCTLR
jgi:hypothetical protein